LTDFDFDGGLARAIELDDRLHTTGRPVGPLHGVPISSVAPGPSLSLSSRRILTDHGLFRIKDHINVKGRVSSSGVLAWALEGKNADEDGVFVRILRDAGAGQSKSASDLAIGPG
jgi:amidase